VAVVPRSKDPAFRLVRSRLAGRREADWNCQSQASFQAEAEEAAPEMMVGEVKRSAEVAIAATAAAPGRPLEAASEHQTANQLPATFEEIEAD